MTTHAKWLSKNIAKFGGTYWFPPKQKARLEKLIAKYGNTMFW